MRTAFNFISAFVVAVCIVVAIVLIILYATGTVHYVLDPLTDFVERGGVEELIGSSAESSGLPPTWTPRVTFVPTTVPAETSQVASSVPTDTPVGATTSTSESSGEATVGVVQSPAILPTVTVLPSGTPLPLAPSSASPTPQPLYVLQDLLGGADCDYVGFSGTVWDVDGSGRGGVRIELFNDDQVKRSVWTDENGSYELIINNKPQPELEGNWHIRVLENKVQVSNEIIVVMSSTCEEDDLTRFVANFRRTQ